MECQDDDDYFVLDKGDILVALVGAVLGLATGAWMMLYAFTHCS